MTDEMILKKLYELRALKSTDAEKYIDKWIDSTKMDISEASLQSVGFGNAFKSMKKIRSNMKKKCPSRAFMLRASKKYHFILTDGIQAIHSRSDMNMPTTAKETDFADGVLEMFALCRKVCTAPLNKPMRSEVDALIKMNKALPKEERDNIVLYEFGEGEPVCDAEALLNISACFPAPLCYYNKAKGANSPVYFRWEMIEGLLMPAYKS